MATIGTGLAQSFSMMSYNVRGGVGLDGVRDLDRTARVICGAGVDFVAVQELDSVTRRSGGVDILQILAQKCAMQHLFARAIAYDGGAYGVGLLSRERPISVEKIPLDGREEKRVLLIAEFDSCVIFCTHLSLTPQDQTSSIERIIIEARKQTKPVFLLGDLNTEPQSEQIDALAEYFTIISDTTQKTYPADSPNRTIDYIMGANSHKYTSVETSIKGTDGASDHRAVVVNFKCKEKL